MEQIMEMTEYARKDNITNIKENNIFINLNKVMNYWKNKRALKKTTARIVCLTL
jgi:hypothetical protein